jgi:bacterioferritin-associated ferredoxin
MALDETAFEMHNQIHNMIVCLCHPTSDRDVDEIIDDGARTVEEISRRIGAGTWCGACLGELRERLQAKGGGASNRDCHTSSELISPDLLADLAR